MKELTNQQIKVLCWIFPISALIGPIGIFFNAILYIIIAALVMNAI